MTEGEDFLKQRKYKKKHCSSMSNNAWCDLTNEGDKLKLHDKCAKCNCHKLITFTPHQFSLEVGSIESKLKSIFKKKQRKLGMVLLNQV